jgi:hypothetical protein
VVSNLGKVIMVIVVAMAAEVVMAVVAAKVECRG